MLNLTEKHTQDLQDVLSAARLRFTDSWNATICDMFRASFGGLFCNNGAMFGEKIDAYDANKGNISEVLAEIAVELEARLS